MRFAAPHIPSDAADVTSPATAAALREHLREHRLNVLAASAMALIFSAIGWGVLYGGLYWITMFVQTTLHGGDAGVPAVFHSAMGWCALGLMLAAMLDAYLHPHERQVDDRPTIEHIGDTLLFLPRLTLAVLQNFKVWPRISSAEIPVAAQLMDRLRLENVPLHTLPLDFPNKRTRVRILIALQVAQLAEVRSENEALVLHLHPLAPDPFRTPPTDTEKKPTKPKQADASELPDAGRLLE